MIARVPFPRSLQPVLALLLLCSVTTQRSTAHAGCNVIPGTALDFNATRGATNRPYAAPGEIVEMNLRGCDALDASHPALSTTATNQVVTVIFTPPTGPQHAIVLTADASCATHVDGKLAACAAQLTGGATATATCLPSASSGLDAIPRDDGITYVRFKFPDTDAIYKTCAGGGMGANTGAPCESDAACTVSGTCTGGTNDDITLTGPAAIVISKNDDTTPLPCGVASTGCAGTTAPLACADQFYASDGACGKAVPHPTYTHFTALPVPNNYKADCFNDAPPCLPTASALRFTTDTDGNILMPMLWSGVQLPSTVPVPRLLKASYRPPFDFAVPDSIFLRSFSPEGGQIQPVFEPTIKAGNALNDTVDMAGSVDAPYTMLRIANRHGTCASGFNAGKRCSNSADCFGAPCPLACRDHPAVTCTNDGDCASGPCGRLYDTAQFASEGTLTLGRDKATAPGICQDDSTVSCTSNADCLTGTQRCVQYALQANSPVDVSSINIKTADLRTYSVIEALGGRDENNDGETRDHTAVLRDRVTGVVQPAGTEPACGINASANGRAVVSTTVDGTSFPAIATENDLMAMLESEPAQKNCEINGDGDHADPVLRVFELRYGERKSASLPNVIVDGLPVIDGQAVKISSGLVFARRSELQQSYKVTEAASTDDGFHLFISHNPKISGDGRYVVWQKGTTGTLSVHDRCASHGARVGGPNPNPTCTPSNEAVSAGPIVTDDEWAISRNGRWVMFTKLTSHICVGGSNDGGACQFASECPGGGTCPSARQVYLRDRQLQTTELVSVAPNGTTLGDNNSNVSLYYGLPRASRGVISDDGRYVVFDSDATNLVGPGNDTNGQTDVFLRDRTLGSTVRISSDLPGQNDLGSRRPTMSADGRFIAYDSCLDDPLNFITCSGADVFVHDQETGVTSLVSYPQPGTPYPHGDSRQPAISADGRYVCFQTTNGGLTPDAATGIVVRNLATGAIELIDTDNNGNPSYLAEMCDISADGRYVAFMGFGIVDGNSGYAFTSHFVHDRATGITELLERDTAGTIGTSCCSSNVVEWSAPSLSDDGSVVAFSTAYQDLVPGDAHNTGFADFADEVFVRAPNPAPTNIAASDLDGDGKLDVRPLFILDAAPAPSRTPVPTSTSGTPGATPTDPPGTPTPGVPSTLTLCAADAVSVAGGNAAYLRHESSGATGTCAAGSLNGDGDTNDAVVHLWKPGAGPKFPGTSVANQNLHCAATAVSLSSDFLGAIVTETGQPIASFHPVNAPQSGSCGDHWAFTGQAADTIVVSGSTGVFITPESLQGQSLNGDIDQNDRVLQVYTLAKDGSDDAVATAAPCQLVGSGAACSAGVRLAAEEFVVGDEAPSACAGGNVQLVAFRTSEAAQNNTNLNGDGLPNVDDVMQVYDVVSGTLKNTGQAAIPCNFDACDPRVPYRVSGSTVKFLTLESQQGGLDLDRNGNSNGLVLQSFDFCTGNTTTVGAVNPLSSKQNPLDTEPVFTLDAGRCKLGSPATCSTDTDCVDPAAFCDLDTCDIQLGRCMRRDSVTCSGDAQCQRCLLRAPGTCDVNADCPSGTTCDLTSRITVPAEAPDADLDGITDADDNCPDYPNPDQIDQDDDGVGDVCDPDSNLAGTFKLGAKTVQVKDANGDPAKRSISVQSKDASILAPAPNSASDPTQVGATFTLVNPITNEIDVISLPASNWKGLGKPAGAKGWSYKDSKLLVGPCKGAQLKKKGMKVQCKGTGLTFTLDEVSQQSLAAALDVGVARYCVAVSGLEVSKDISTSGGNGQFKAKGTTPAATCPIP